MGKSRNSTTGVNIDLRVAEKQIRCNHRYNTGRSYSSARSLARPVNLKDLTDIVRDPCVKAAIPDLSVAVLQSGEIA